MPAALLAGFLKGKAQAEQQNEQRALQKEKLSFEKKRLDLEEKESVLKQKMIQDSMRFGQGLSQQLEPTRPTPGAVMPSGEQMPSEIIEQPPEGIGAELVLPSRKTHYRLTENALHYSLPKRRTHYEVGEET